MKRRDFIKSLGIFAGTCALAPVVVIEAIVETKALPVLDYDRLNAVVRDNYLPLIPDNIFNSTIWEYRHD